MSKQMANALTCSNLRIVSRSTGVPLVDDVSLSVERGEFVGLVGESGSGKSTICFALLGLIRKGTQVTHGQVRIGGIDPLSLPSHDLLKVRRSEIAYVPQSAGYALNPALTISRQLQDRLPGAVDAHDRISHAFNRVSLPATKDFLERYPHQLSGGQQQRVAIASALVTNPKVIVFDEPTTGLDVAVQAQILDMIRRLCADEHVASLFISHDLAAVASLCSRTIVMRQGRVVEAGETRQVLRTPNEEYTKTLVRSMPSLSASLAIIGPRGKGYDRPSAIGNASALSVDGLSAYYGSKRVLHGLNLSIKPGECTALVGESGSGKTTLCRALIGLHSNYEGAISLDGGLLQKSSLQRSFDNRRRMQYVFQNPYDSLNPRRTVRDIILEPIRFLGQKRSGNFASEQLKRVRLPTSFVDRYPHQLSGGERQRVALARSLAANPRFLICDEVTSALDVSVQASVLDLIMDIRREMGLTVLFVTHHIALVPAISDNVIVLKDGRAVDFGPTADVLINPRSEYTRSLLELTLDPGRTQETPSATASALGPDDHAGLAVQREHI